MKLVFDPSCRFCRTNQLLIDKPLVVLGQFYVLGSIEDDRPHQAIIVPHRHIETPFDLNADEWSEIGESLAFVKSHLSTVNPSGFTVGWNVGAVAGQDVLHTHLHVIARFKGEQSEKIGIHGLFRQSLKAH